MGGGSPKQGMRQALALRYTSGSVSGKPETLMKALRALSPVVASLLLLASTPADAQATTFYGCIDGKTQLLRMVSQASECDLKKEALIQWNNPGPQGPQGPQGSAGTTTLSGELQEAFDLVIQRGRLYVTNGSAAYGSQDTVSVLDVPSNTRVATFATGGNYPYALAANRAGTRIYVVNSDSASLGVIDTGTNVVVGTLPVAALPVDVLVNPSQMRVYVASLSGAVSVFDTSTNLLVAQIPLGGEVFFLSTNPSGTRLYVSAAPYLHVVDTQSNVLITSINVGNQSGAMAYSAATNRLYIVQGNENQITVVDAGTNTVLATLTGVGARPYGVVSNQSGSRVWFSSMNSQTVSRLDPSTNTVTNTVSLGANPTLIALNDAGTRLYATCDDQTVKVLDASTLQLLAAVPVPGAPRAMALIR
jgi:YVTN family beta-propeller protein